MSLTKEYKPGMDFMAKTISGLEEILATELREIGAFDVEPVKRGVKFRANTETLYKANYLCRTAQRILKPIGVFEVKDQDQLYSKVMQIDWTKVFDLNQTFIIHATVFHEELTNSHYVALKTKDGIVDQFREVLGKRPWVGKEKADIYIDVHISQEVCTISLDSSGESLHKRGYRIAADKAPISEVLAAGMIKLSGWKGDKDFYDPMCGSGTIAIEAAMQSMNIPAGYYREEFSFMNWNDFDADLWKKVKDEANDKMGEAECKIFASDRSEKAVGLAKYNIKNAGLHKDIDIKARYFDSVKPEEETGILVFNPPYGKRLEERGDIIDLYKMIGDTLKQNFTGFEAWVISSNFEAAKFIGLRPSAKIPIFNGPMEAKIIKFEMYEGSKKDMYDDSPRERKEYTKRDDGDRKEYRPRDEGNKKSFRKRDDGERRPFNKGGDSERKPFKRRDGEERKDFRKSDDGDRRDFRSRDDSDKKPFRKKDDGERRPFQKRDDSEKRSFTKRDDEGRKDFRKKDDADKKDFRPKDEGYNKPFQKRDDEEHRPFRKKEGNDVIIRSLNEEDRTGHRKLAEGKRHISKPSDSNSKKEKDQKSEEGVRKRRPRTGSKPKDES